MRGLVALAVRRPVAVMMTAIAVAAFGVVGYQRLALDLLPDISYPSLTIQTDFPDTAPAEVENLITRPIEETIGVLQGLRTIHSVSRPGVSEVTLEFDWDADMNMLSMDVREKLDRLVLPEGTEDPIVLRYDPSLDPIMRIALHGAGDLTATRRIADLRLKQELETVRGVAAAQVRGGFEEEIRIDIDQERLAALGITLDHVRAAVAAANINIPGGSLRDEDSQYLIRTVGEFAEVAEIGAMVLRQRGNAVVRLKDVAEVYRGTKEREEISRVDGVESVEINIYKEGDANIVTAARGVRERVAELEENLPPGGKLTVLFDQSRFIEQAIKEVRLAAVLGGVLAILVLFAFLRDGRSTLIIATSIPLSVLAAFLAMYRLNISLNIMSLGGLTLGIGMLVDNSIVVLESIFRRRQGGLSLVAAAVAGTAEVGGAVVAATLTTVAVFLPIVFVEGIAGQIFGDMAMTVTLSLLASLLVAVTIIPMLGSVGRRRAETAGAPEASAVVGVGDDEDAAADPSAPTPMTLGRFSAGYDRFLRGALSRRALTLGLAAAIFAAAVLAIPAIDTELIPAISEGEFFFEVDLPGGTPLAATDQVMQRMEAIVAAEPAVAHQYSTVGSRLVSGGVSLNTRAEHLGQLNVVIGDRADEAAEALLSERLRERFAAIPDLTAKLGKPTYFSLKTPVEVILYGEDLAALDAYAGRLERRLRNVPGLVDLRSSLEEGSPELRVIFDRARLAALGLDMRSLSETLRDRLQGVVPTRFKEGDRQIDVRVRNREQDRATLADLRNMVVPGPEGRPLRLLTLAEIHIDRGPAEIHRIQQQRGAVVSGNLQGRSLGAVVGDIERVLGEIPAPRGVSVELGGQNQEMQVSFASLRFALALAVFLVYLVMAATFESLIHPFIVLFSIPLAVVGVVGGLLLTGTPISVIVLIGVVMLVGIVVNNAIVLIAKINQLRRAGLEKRLAVIRACHVRLRPILMTTLTTVLGLLPMALAVGEGAELRTPLAITVSFGLAISTLLTLAVIPVLYLLVPSRVRTRASEVADLEGAEGVRP
ncbi:MAG: efflux RND transporter permease subunit [Candidatus Eisenbacteria sp.]|nr:efflux RND transporter permease subunit [Candidatus Eisenbacteria bacterium]